MPGLAGYARYPTVDAPQRSEFAAGCPASAKLSAHNLTANHWAASREWPFGVGMWAFRE